MKKFLITFMCLAMVAVFVPVMSFADTSYFTVDVNGQTVSCNSTDELDAAINGAADDATITVTLNSDYAGGGLSIKGTGKNITFDLNGNTWTVTEPPVGSPGTVTNGFQLLKGNTITFKNGNIVASEDTEAKLLIQNYGDLNLVDVTVDVSKAPEALIYAVSHNNGNLNITGSSSIIAPGRTMAFDVYYWPTNGYDEAHVVVDTTGTIDGKIMYGGDKAGYDNLTDKISITIKNAIVTEGFALYNLGDDNATAITLEKGTFADIPANVNKASTHEATITDADGNTVTVLGLDKLNEELAKIPADKIGDYTVEIVKADEDAQVVAPEGLTVKNSSGNNVKVNEDPLADGDELIAKLPVADDNEPSDDVVDADNDKTDDTTTADKTDASTPKTGDETNVIALLGTMLLAAAGGLVAVKKRSQK